jgi:hypothetical protein
MVGAPAGNQLYRKLHTTRSWDIQKPTQPLQKPGHPSAAPAGRMASAARSRPNVPTQTQEEAVPREGMQAVLSRSRNASGVASEPDAVPGRSSVSWLSTWLACVGSSGGGHNQPRPADDRRTASERNRLDLSARRRAAGS